MLLLLLTFERGAGQPAATGGKGGKPDYEEIRTREGKVFHDCYIKKVEPDALTVRHSNGMARISFFSLSKEIRDRFDFDPIAAARKANADDAKRRETKWRLIREKEKHEAAQAKQAEKEQLYRTAKRNWLPVKVTILKLRDGGAYVKGSRIVFVATKTKSTLGFSRPGPPKKEFVPLAPAIIFIRNPFGKITTPPGTVWEGYLEPFSIKKVQGYYSESTSTQLRRALPKAK